MITEILSRPIWTEGSELVTNSQELLMQTSLRLTDPEEANKNEPILAHNKSHRCASETSTCKAASTWAKALLRLKALGKSAWKSRECLQEWALCLTLAADLPGSPMHWGWSECSGTTPGNSTPQPNLVRAAGSQLHHSLTGISVMAALSVSTQTLRLPPFT